MKQIINIIIFILQNTKTREKASIPCAKSHRTPARHGFRMSKTNEESALKKKKIMKVVKKLVCKRWTVLANVLNSVVENM